ncbi:uncharacterized protein [Spinacia oleracea]|uniref:Reverse transcriptase domain-containing protein n=1 Tax=Spinacia oleracea TaxID=3562 RepID=A0A9R0IZP6_SPIOL|nr:uncharacterized protein LOC110797262 [Spinacia oleracea]
MWKSSSSFIEIVQQQWNQQVHGSKILCLVTRLKKVKIALKEINKKGFSNVQEANLKENQAMIKDGDENTTLFHQSIKSRNVQNQVYSIHGMVGVWGDTPASVSNAFSEYYVDLLGKTHDHMSPTVKEVVQDGPVVTNQHRVILNAPYTRDEVKQALFSIPGVKAHEPDGVGSFSNRDAWHIVENDVVDAVLDVLNHGKFLKELNHTVIALIPKTKCPQNVSDFRPISYCNTLYKCITKVICGRLRLILPDLILGNQGGFVHGKYIAYNIMVIQDPVKHYGRKSVKPSCLLKVDLLMIL